MQSKNREADYLAKAEEAQAKSDRAMDYTVKAAWGQIAAHYRALAKSTKQRGF